MSNDDKDSPLGEDIGSGDEDDGEYECHICGETFDKEMGLRGHMNAHRDEDEEIEDVDKTSSRPVPPSPEKQMINEMAEVLEDELAMAPGGSEDKATYVVHKFKNNSIYREDDLKLYKLIKNVVPKMNTDLINDIVDSVINIKQEYKSGDMGRSRSPMNFERDEGGRSRQYPSQRPSSPSRRGRSRKEQPMRPEDMEKKIEEKAEELAQKKIEEKKREERFDQMQQQIEQLTKTVNRLAQGGIERESKEEDEDDEYEKMLKFLRLTEEMKPDDKDDKYVTKEDLEKLQKDQTIQTLRQEIQQLDKRIKYASQGSGDFESDDAKIIAEGLNHIGRKMEHSHETVKNVVDKLPQILGNTQHGQDLSDDDLKQIENELDKIEQQEIEQPEQAEQPQTQFTAQLEEEENNGLLEEELEEELDEESISEE